MKEIERLNLALKRFESDKLILIGCGILEREINFIITKNRWPIKTYFLPPLMHLEHDDLYHSLNQALEKYRDKNKIIFYGACHPSIDELCSEYKTARFGGQNCLESLLGREQLDRLMEEGAFLLLEGWVRRWETIVKSVFGSRVNVAREIFKARHNHFLAIRTICSGDFSSEAAVISELMEMPLLWADIGLDVLEESLEKIMIKQLL